MWLVFELYGIVPHWLAGFEALSGSSKILIMPVAQAQKSGDFIGFALLKSK